MQQHIAPGSKQQQQQGVAPVSKKTGINSGAGSLPHPVGQKQGAPPQSGGPRGIKRPAAALGTNGIQGGGGSGGAAGPNAKKMKMKQGAESLLKGVHVKGGTTAALAGGISGAVASGAGKVVAGEQKGGNKKKFRRRGGKGKKAAAGSVNPDGTPAAAAVAKTVVPGPPKSTQKASQASFSSNWQAIKRVRGFRVFVGGVGTRWHHPSPGWVGHLLQIRLGLGCRGGQAWQATSAGGSALTLSSLPYSPFPPSLQAVGADGSGKQHRPEDGAVGTEGGAPKKLVAKGNDTGV